MSSRPLAALPGLLAGEAALAELLGVDDAVVAVPESARSVVLAAVAELGTSPTVLVATATAREAEQLQHDLVPFLGVDAVELLPAWETLPFERVSPATETMGRRLRTMWRLRHGRGGRFGAPAGLRLAARDGCRRRPDPCTSAKAWPEGRRRRAGRSTPGHGAGPRGPGGAAGPRRVPARVPGRSAGRACGPGWDRRRVRVDGEPPDPDRPVRRRGRAADGVRGRGAALGCRSRAGRALRLPRGRAHRRRA